MCVRTRVCEAAREGRAETAPDPFPGLHAEGVQTAAPGVSPAPRHPQAAEGLRHRSGPEDLANPHETPHTQLTGPSQKGRGTFTRQERSHNHEAGLPRSRLLRALWMADPCDFPKCGKLDCIIGGGGRGLHSTFPQTDGQKGSERESAPQIPPLLHRPQGLGSCRPRLSALEDRPHVCSNTTGRT